MQSSRDIRVLSSRAPEAWDEGAWSRDGPRTPAVPGTTMRPTAGRRRTTRTTTRTTTSGFVCVRSPALRVESFVRQSLRGHGRVERAVSESTALFLVWLPVRSRAKYKTARRRLVGSLQSGFGRVRRASLLARQRSPHALTLGSRDRKRNLWQLLLPCCCVLQSSYDNASGPHGALMEHLIPYGSARGRKHKPR